MSSKKEVISYLETVSLFILGIVLLAFPLVFTSLTTDSFVLPKQILLGVGALVSILLYGTRLVVEGKVKLRTTPFDLPLLLFTVIAAISAVLSINRYDSLISFVPLLFAVLSYFAIVNVVKGRNAVLFIVSCLVAGGTIAALYTALAFFKIYPLPFAYAQNQAFNLFGSLLDQALYFALVLPIALYMAWPIVRAKVLPGSSARNSGFNEEGINKRKLSGVVVGFSAAFVVMSVGLGITLFMLLTTQKPLILPLETGFQTAFAAISQDEGRVAKSFLFGSGFGTYMTDFTRFKQPSYNLNETLWSFTFFRSSTFALELLATVGLLGLLAYLFLIYRVVKHKYYFFPLVLALVASFLLPFSFTLQALLLIILGVSTAIRAYENPRGFHDLEFYFVALKQGLVTARTDEDNEATDIYGRYAKFLPAVFFLMLLVLVGTLGFLSTRYILSNLKFQESFVAISQNDGLKAYNLQNEAIQAFPYEDDYYSRFSQLNLALANSIASAQQPGSSPSAQVQQNILNLTQQSITAARTAVTISPMTALNWNNLSSIYRSLIGFGQNAEQFAVVSNQQAILLDPNNPQQYINLGGIFYQLQAWDEAIRQFQVARNLKPDYANAYYNLGHALESKGDLENAIAAYEQTLSLVSEDKESSKRITDEIAAVRAKIANGGTAPTATNEQARTGEEADTTIGVDQPETALPERNPKAPIPGPSVSVTPTTSPAPSISPSPAE